jgi:hypothetical protein
MTPTVTSPEVGLRLTPEEERARRSHNRAIGFVLAGLVVLFYVVTLAKLGLHLPGRG